MSGKGFIDGNANKLELRHEFAQWWWLTLALVTIFGVLPLTLHLCKAVPSSRYELAYLVATLLFVLPAWFLCPVVWRVPEQYLVRVRNRNGERLEPVDTDSINYTDRLNATRRTLLQSWFIGWAIFVFGIVIAVTGGLSDTEASLAVKGSRLEEMLTRHGTWHTTFAVLNDGAHDLARAATVALIIVFFMQMLRVHTQTLDRTETLTYTLGEIRETFDGLAGDLAHTRVELASAEQEVMRSADSMITLFKVAKGQTEAERLVDSIGRHLELSFGAGQIKQAAWLTRAHLSHLSQIWSELQNEEARVHPAEHVALVATLAAYFDAETLNFHGVNPGQGALEVSSRWVHYAMAVRAIVDSLSGDGTRYQFYSILSRPPKAFFNIANRDTDPRWSILFVEEFCRRHAVQDIRYHRLFATIGHNDHRGVRDLPNARAELAESYILCSGGKPVLNVDRAYLDRHYSRVAEDDADLSSIIDRLCPDAEQEQIASIVNRLPRESEREGVGYLIVSRTEQKKIATTGTLTWEPLPAILADYHNPATPPQWLKFERPANYDAVFDSGVPRDLLAVFDGTEGAGGWVLCLGTDDSGSTDMPIRLRLFTRHRTTGYGGVTWANVERALDRIFFQRGGSDDDGISVEPVTLDHSPTAEQPTAP